MKTKEFFDLLASHPDKHLLIEYHDNKMVGANYHITEVKNITVEAVDCGGNTDSWHETVIQLWENPGEINKRKYMSAYKALGILKKVNSLKPMQQQADLKFEYGNAEFHTAQLPVYGYSIEDDAVKMHLGLSRTECKAEETCGVSIAEPVGAAACAPGRGCC